MKMISKCVGAFAALALSSGVAMASDVTIASASGKAFVDNGSGFVIAKQGAAVSAGDRVMAMSGDVVLSDASGCTMTVKPGDMLAVNGKALCASAMLPAAQGSSSNDRRTPTWVWVAGGLVLVGVVAAIVSDDDDKKTSP